MTVNSYFTLTTSNSSLSKRFRVISEGYIEQFEKKQDVQTTLDGELDVSVGSIFASWSFTVRVRYEEEENDFGTLNDLKQFYLYNRTNGTPSNILTMIDHHGDTHYVIFAGGLQPTPFATALEGTEAWYYVAVNFLNTIGESGPTS
jgi:hypothetical protein